MLVGLPVLALAAVVNALAFFGLRHLVARASGLPHFAVALGRERGGWANVPLSRRILFTIAGPAGCYLAAVAFVTLGLLVGGRSIVDETSMRVHVAPAGPAASAGFLESDRVLALNGVPTTDWDALRAAVAAHHDEPIEVEVESNGQRRVLRPTPGANGKIGVAPLVEHQHVGVLAALAEGLTAPPRVWAVTLAGFYHVVAGQESSPVSGLVGVSKATGEAAQEGAGTTLRFAGALNAYYLWIPTVLALVLFPRRGRRPAG